MPAPSTATDLVTLIRKSELLPAGRLDAFLELDGIDPADTPQTFAQRLIGSGLITQFQADQFLQGKWRGFTIGKYRVLERLGSGGMGTVYLCEHLMVGRKVAIKVLPTTQAANPSALGRFYREARAAGVLNHPNLVKAHDIDQESGWHYLVMDYIDGVSLHELVTRHGPLAPVRAAHYIRQAAEGLQAAHQAGLVHRDIKPSNIMLGRDGLVRVLDLGLARFYDDQVDPLTLKYDEKNVLGTADYVAPEQAINSHEADIRADIYSLGATFYFLLVGHPPFPTGRIAQKLIWHQVKDPTPVRQLRPAVPAGMAAVVAQMLAKPLTDRYQEPAEVAAALAPWTAVPIALPDEAEMPQLSRAAVASSSGPPTPITPSRPSTARHLRPTIPIQTSDSHQGRTVSLAHPPAAADLATPANLAAQVATETDQPRPAPTEPEPWWRTAPSAAPPSSVGGTIRQLARTVCFAILSAAAGTGITWLLLRLFS